MEWLQFSKKAQNTDIELNNSNQLISENTTDFRLGRIMFCHCVGYYPTQNLELRIPKGVVTLRVHTHGMSIRHTSGIYEIHHSQVLNIQEESRNSVLSSVIGAGLGLAVGILTGGGIGGAVGATTGAAAFSDSRTNLKISFLDRNERLQNIEIHPRENDKQINFNMFIQSYLHEIETTELTKRKPESEAINLLKIMSSFFKNIFLFFGTFFGILIMIAILVPMCTEDDNMTNSEVTNVQTQKETSKPEPKTANKADATHAGKWIFTGNTCSIQHSGTTLTLTGSEPSNAQLEFTGIPLSDCKNVSVSFDDKKADTVKCKISSQKIKISINERFVKKMRGSKDMTITIPISPNEEKSVKYTLMGFSKACRWTKYNDKQETPAKAHEASPKDHDPSPK